MRKNTLLFLLIFILVKLQAQDYLITFASSGASATVDIIRVENLTQGTCLLVGGGDQLQPENYNLPVDFGNNAFKHDNK